MSEQESLTSIAEFAIALAGFSGIVVALGKQPGLLAPADRFRVLNVLSLTFGAGFMAFLPMGLAHAGLDGPLLWRVSSAGFLCFLVLFNVWIVGRLRHLQEDVRLLIHPVVWWMAATSSSLALLSQLLNLLGIGFEPRFAAYFLGLVLLLLVAAISFARILFARPE